MSHIMLDLETLGTSPGCVILSIGAVVFSPAHGLGAEFSRVISTKSCVAAGLFTERSTLEWWNRQRDDAKRVISLAQCDAACDLRKTLNDFTGFIAVNGGKKDARVWGNGADFDDAILACACRAVNVPLPWLYYHSRCYRTLKACAPTVQPPSERVGVHHDSLDDAKHQARHAIEIMRSFKQKACAEEVNNDSCIQKELVL